MIWLWLFWIEVVLFCGYLLWNLFDAAQHKALTTVQWINAGIYTIALLWSGYGFIRFAMKNRC